MSNTMIYNGNGRELIDDSSRPQQPLSVAESARTLAEIQGALTVAASRPRNVTDAIDRIINTCQRPRMAEKATYQYSKGGQAIAGPSIRLMEAIAGCWGNITFGFRELAQSQGESTVEAFAWDLETNTKRTVTFVVPHRMKARDTYKQIIDPREVYEHVANQAQRRVRACLENVIPRDIVEDAVDECDRTLKATVEVTPESIKKMALHFHKEYGVTKAQIEQRLQRRLESITPANMIAMRRIVNSINEGMSEPSDWFKPVESGDASEIERLRKEKHANRGAGKSTGNEPAEAKKTKTAGKEKPESTEKANATPAVPPEKPELNETAQSFYDEINKTGNVGMLQEFADTIAESKDINDKQRQWLFSEINWRIEELE